MAAAPRSATREQNALVSTAPWILCVDDEPLAARALARLLTASFEVRVECAADSAEARRLLEEARVAPAGLILDFELARGETGADLLQQLRALGCFAPCLFWTGAPVALRARLARLGSSERPLVAEKGPSIAAITDWVTRLLDSRVAESDAGGMVRRQSGVRRRIVAPEKERDSRS
jgi:CheY-like chemotaxis protein